MRIFKKTLAFPNAVGAAGAALMLAALGCDAVDLNAPAADAPAGVEERTVALATAYDWLQLYGDGSHAGNDTKESILTASKVSALAQLFQITLPAEGGTATYSEGPPAILTAINAGGQVRDLAFVTSRLGTLYAIDARSGAIVWSAKPAPTSPTSDFTNSSPAVDPSRADVYSYGFDGKVHKYAVATGVEVTTGGWPEVTTVKPDQEKGITSLTTATDASGNTYLYVGHSGYGDSLDSQGHVTAINLATGAQKVFNAMCSTLTTHLPKSGCAQKLGSIWGRAPMVYSAATNRIYGATGNGLYDPTNHFWGDSVLALNPDGSGNAAGDPLDTYTPTSQGTLQSNDLDLGSASVALLPTTGTKYPHLGLQAGKDNTLRIVNLDNLSNGGTAGPGHVGGELWSLPLDTAHAQKATVANSMPVWTNPSDGSTWVFVPAEYELFAFKLLLDGSGNPSLGAMWSVPNLVYPGGSLLVANNVLYWAYSATQTGSGNVKALAPTTGATLWTSSAIGGIHWQSPVVANGVLYITDNAGHLTAFAPASSPLPRTGWTATASPASTTDVPAHALDGVETSRFTTGVAQANGDWFKLDMKASTSINELVLDATNSPSDYPRGYSVTLSADDVTYTAPVATGAGAIVTITFATQAARYVKITQTGSASNWWSIDELNVYGPGGAPALTAYPRTGWAASAQATSGSDVPAHALDGNSATRWSDGIPQSTMTSPAQYFQVDMGVSQPFSQITLDAAGSTGDYLRNYQVLVGTTSPPTTSVATGTGTSALTTISFPSTTARYIRVVQTSAASGVGSWWSIAELNVWH